MIGRTNHKDFKDKDVVKIDKVFVHPEFMKGEFDFESTRDVALMKLARPFSQTTTICLPTETQCKQVKTAGYSSLCKAVSLAGWGYTEDFELSDILQEAEGIKVFENATLPYHLTAGTGTITSSCSGLLHFSTIFFPLKLSF